MSTAVRLSRPCPAPHPTADVPPGARRHPPSVGLQLSLTTRPAVLPPEHTRYDARIMHRVLLPTLFDVRVSRDASPHHFAAAFRLPVALVNAHWLTSRSSMELPGFDHSVAAPTQPQQLSPPRTPPLSPATLAAHAHLAAAVSAKLAAHLLAVQEQPSSPSRPQNSTTLNNNNKRPARPSRARIQQILDAAGVAPPRHLPSVSTRLVAHPIRAPRPICGFNVLGSHPDLSLERDHTDVVKPANGLYRVARAAAPLQRGVASYAELTVVHAGGEGALAVGVAPSSHPLNRLPGTDARSAALHASGAFVTKEGDWISACDSLRDGDVVGLAVTRGDSAAEVTFFVNGACVGRRRVRDDGPALHMVACLYRPGARVRLSCCPGEWRFFAGAAREVKALRPSCMGEEDVEAEMSSTSAMSGSEGGSGYRTSKNRQSPVKRVLVPRGKAGGTRSCGSVLTPGDRLL